jgi:ribonucleoside-diphosphate reductase alpha chain
MTTKIESKIESKIVGFELVKDAGTATTVDTIKSTAPAKRESVLSGKTYKIKDHTNDATLYVTINDIDGRPFEIFINSKKMEHYQWVVALTRVMSAVFREVDNVDFLIEELTSVFDPRGGYWHEGKFIPSLVAHIGRCIEQHVHGIKIVSTTTKKTEGGKMMCPKCNEMTLVKAEGCESCLSCDYSKCS